MKQPIFNDDFYIEKKVTSVLLWNKRGRVVSIADERKAQEIIEIQNFKRVTKDEKRRGVKVGSYNPMYDEGEKASREVIGNVVQEVTGTKKGDHLDVLIV